MFKSKGMDMPEINQAALDFLMTRRSRPAKTLDLPIPDRKELLSLLTAAARTPDHGKLEPWRFIVLSKDKLRSLAHLVAGRGAALGHEPEKIEKAQGAYNTGHLAVAVIEVQKPSEKIPAIEQTYSAGAVCLALLNAALASGWGANWISGWPSHDRGFVEAGFGLVENERVAGIIYLGSERATPPERPRPNLDDIVSWE
jgi:nitroreductase